MGEQERGESKGIQKGRVEQENGESEIMRHMGFKR